MKSKRLSPLFGSFNSVKNMFKFLCSLWCGWFTAFSAKVLGRYPVLKCCHVVWSSSSSVYCLHFMKLSWTSLHCQHWILVRIPRKWTPWRVMDQLNETGTQSSSGWRSACEGQTRPLSVRAGNFFKDQLGMKGNGCMSISCAHPSWSELCGGFYCR